MLIDFRSCPDILHLDNVRIQSLFIDLSVPVSIFMDVLYVLEAFVVFLISEHDYLKLLERIVGPEIGIDLMEG
jgi:hypothetical protein